MAGLSGKVLSITGGASGMGLAIAKAAAQQGAKLALADVDKEGLERVVQSLNSAGFEAIGSVVNVASAQEVDKWINSIIEHYGRLDAAANFAGIEGKMQKVIDQSDKDWDQLLSINLTGVMYCMRAELRVMKDGGSVVNAASIAGLRGSSGLGCYSASKHAVIGLTKCAAKEEGARRIRVNAIAPGPVATPMYQRLVESGTGSGIRSFSSSTAALPLLRAGEPEEVAALAIFLLGDSSSYITGVAYPVDGGALS